MSFLIEDILKKDFTTSNNKKYLQCNKKRTISETSQTNKSEDFEKTSNLNNYSILQQTLLNRINPYFSQVNDCYASERPYSNVYNCDKTYLPHNYFDFYTGNGNSYLSLYTRNRFYSSYESVPMMFHMSSKRKGGQVRFTSTQTDALEKRFNSHKYLSPEERRILADSLKLTDKQVKTWFQNRRAKWRRSNSTSSNNTDGECDNQAESDSERVFCDKRLKNCMNF